MKKAPQLQVKQKNNIVIAGLGGLRDERGPT